MQSLDVEPTGDLEMIEAIRKEVQRLCTRDAVVAHIIEEDNAESYNKDYTRLFTTSEIEKAPTSALQTPRGMSREKALLSRTTTRSRASRAASQASQRGWDPILGGYQAREIMSRAPTPGNLHMEHSYLPMDLNSASSENSSVIGLDDDEFLDDDDDERDEGLDPDLMGDSITGESVTRDGVTRDSVTRDDVTQSLNQVEGTNRTLSRSDSRSRGRNSRTEPTILEANDKETGRESVISERAQEEDLCSDVDSSKEDPELLELADETSEHQSISQDDD